jgi:hypothetical protein
VPTRAHALVDRVDVGDRYLEVDASTERLLKRRSSETSTWPRGFLDHEVRALEIEVGEAFFRPLEHECETDELYVEVQGGVKVGHIEFRHEARLDFVPAHDCHGTRLRRIERAAMAPMALMLGVMTTSARHAKVEVGAVLILER